MAVKQRKPWWNTGKNPGRTRRNVGIRTGVLGIFIRKLEWRWFLPSNVAFFHVSENGLQTLRCLVQAGTMMMHHIDSGGIPVLKRSTFISYKWDGHPSRPTIFCMKLQGDLSVCYENLPFTSPFTDDMKHGGFPIFLKLPEYITPSIVH